MAKWRVKAFQLGSIDADHSGLVHFRGLGTKLVVPVWCVALTDGKTKVLVDTGMDDLEWTIANPEPYAHQEPHQQMRPALKKAMGWTPEQVDIVINTHLHFDHCCCNYMFTNADIYVQRLELESAYNPPVATAALYAQRGFDKKAVPYFQWKLVDGEMTILPGLIVFPTPGHTYGHQSVLVDTEEGALCVAGDVVALTENINDNIEGSSIVDAAAVYKSFAAIRRRADRIIPGHETSIPDGAENGFPLIA